MRTRNIILLAAALMVATPAITTLTGCGGSNGVSIGNRSINNLPVAFGNGQTGQLDLGIVNRAINAVLRVLPTPVPGLGNADRVSTQAIPQIPAGTYNGTGTIDSSGNFTVTFDLVAPAPDIVITGSVPTRSSTGAYTVAVAGQSFSGTFPTLGQNTPTPTTSGTPTATATATPQAQNAFNGNITGLSGTNVTAGAFQIPLKTSSIGVVEGGAFVATFEGTDSGNVKRSLQFEIAPAGTTGFQAGQTISTIGSNGVAFFESVNGANTKIWESISGTFHVDSYDGTILRFTLQGLRLQPRIGNSAQGSFTLSGSGQALKNFG